MTLEEKLLHRLRRNAIVSDDQLELVRTFRAESPVSLAEALIQLDILSHGEVESIVGSLNEVRSVKLEDLQIDLESVKHIPRHVALSRRCVPVRRSGNSLVVAVSSANVDSILNELRAVTDFEIVLVMAEPEALEHALFIHYGKEFTNQSIGRNEANQMKLVSKAWSIPPAWTQSFETLVEHDGNSNAKRMAKLLAYGAWESFHAPIMLVGPPESGKTHLLNSIVNYCTAKDPLLRGVLTTGDQLLSCATDYLIAGKFEALKYQIRDCSILLIDDVAGCWHNERVECELAEAILNLRATGSTAVLSMTESDFVSGPSTVALQNALKQGSEIFVSLPTAEVMRDIVASRFNMHNPRADKGIDNIDVIVDSEWSVIKHKLLANFT